MWEDGLAEKSEYTHIGRGRRSKIAQKKQRPMIFERSLRT